MKKYSPRIDQHTPVIYQLAKKLNKPMTVVADDLIRYGLENIEKLYPELGEGELKVAESKRKYREPNRKK